MKKRLLIAIFALITPALVFVGYIKAKPLAHRLSIQARTPARFQLPSGSVFQGLTAVTEDYVGCQPGTCGKPSTQRIYALTADGRTAEQFWEFSQDGTKNHTRSLIDGEGTRAYVIPGAKVKTTYRIPANDAVERKANRLNPAKGCTETMLGKYPYGDAIKVVGQEDLVTTDDQVAFHTTKFHVMSASADTYFWLAPDLACMEIQSQYNWRQAKDGTTYLTTTHLLRSVKLGAPPEDVFTVPSDVVEMKPSDVARVLFIHKGKIAGHSQEEGEREWKAIPDVKHAGLARNDEFYRQHKANAE